jgi:hypothetical protein
VIVARWPATMMLPARSLPSLGSTVTFTVAFPLPVSGAVSLIQPASVVAFHAHSLAVATVTLAAPPAALAA